MKIFKHSKNIRNKSTTPNDSNQATQHQVTPSKETSQQNTSPPQTETHSSNRSLICSVGSIMGICVLITAIVLNTFPSSKPEIRQCSFDFLKTEFPNEDDMLWKSFRLSVKSVLEEEKQSVFLLAYSGTEPPKRLIDAIVNMTVHCMSGKDAIKLDYRDFASKELIKDYGVVVSKYREPLQKRGVMLINDVNKVTFYLQNYYNFLMNGFVTDFRNSSASLPHDMRHCYTSGCAIDYYFYDAHRPNPKICTFTTSCGKTTSFRLGRS